MEEKKCGTTGHDEEKKKEGSCGVKNDPHKCDSEPKKEKSSGCGCGTKK